MDIGPGMGEEPQPHERRFSAEEIDELLGASWSDLRAELEPDLDDPEADIDTLIRTTFILRETASLMSRAAKTDKNTGSRYLTVEDSIIIGGQPRIGEYHKIVLAPEGYKIPSGNPDALEHLIVRVRPEDIPDREALICWLEHRVPAGYLNEVRVSRYVVTKTQLFRWTIGAEELVAIEDQEQKLEILDELDYLIDNLELSEQPKGPRVKNGRRTVYLRPDDELEAMYGQPEETDEEEVISPDSYTEADDQEALLRHAWGRFFDQISERFHKALDRTKRDNPTDICGQPYYRVCDLGENVRIFLTDEQTAEVISQTHNANTSSGLLISMPLPESFQNQLRAAEDRGLERASVLRSQLHRSIDEAINSHVIIEHRNEQGNIHQEWSIFPSRVEITTPMPKRKLWTDVIERSGDRRSMAERGNAPYAEMLERVISLTERMVLSTIVPDEKPYHPRGKR